MIEQTIAAILLILVIAVFAIIVGAFFFNDNWEYRNPANRTCKKCGINQMGYMTNWSSGSQSHWWENNGKLPEHPCWHHKFEAKE